MIGITLSTDQIRTAPTEVRRWIEREVSKSLGLLPMATGSDVGGAHLVACTPDEIAGIFAAIREILPAVNVFFEFGREGISLEGVEAFRLIDIMHHARLQAVSEVVTCLDIINRTLHQVRNDPAASFCGYDQDGHCFIATETRQNITRLWRAVVESRSAAVDRPVATPAANAPSPQPAAHPAPAF